MNVVLIGFMGTGKSALGRVLADHFGAAFMDADVEIEREAGKPIRRIFAENGESVFREMETALLQRIASAPTPQNARVVGTVIATGGGMPLRAENAALLRRIGRVVWLTAPAETILQRVGPDVSVRPLLASYCDDPLSRIESLLAARAPYYAAAADLTWDTGRHASHVDAAASLAEELCQPATQPEPSVPDKMA